MPPASGKLHELRYRASYKSLGARVLDYRASYPGTRVLGIRAAGNAGDLPFLSCTRFDLFRRKHRRFHEQHLAICNSRAGLDKSRAEEGRIPSVHCILAIAPAKVRVLDPCGRSHPSATPALGAAQGEETAVGTSDYAH